jgi:hypothetical protein
VDPSSRLNELFAVDDGSLPEIRIEGLDSRSIAAALDLIKGLATGPLKYGHEKGAAAPAGASHFVVGLKVGGSELPELGFAQFEDALIIDYRMGPVWSIERINGLLELLHRICGLHQGAYVEIEPEADPELRRTFQKTWMQFLTRKGAA